MTNLTRREMLKSAAALPVAGLLLSQTGCTNTLATDLDLIVSAASAALDVAFPSLGTLLGPYFTEVTTFVDEATAELGSTDSAAVKAQVIAQDALIIVLPNLPPGTATDIATEVSNVVKAIGVFLADIKSVTAAIQATPGGANAFFAGKGYKPPSAKQLAQIRAANAALKAKLAGKIAAMKTK